jgi:ribulose 1,5-bisphosphate synthetase/thiazole synthase
MIETEISRAITAEYNKKLTEHLENDVVIVGAGPAGLTAGYYLSKAGYKTILLERKLSVGGGIWGGAAGYNVVVTQDSDIPDEFEMTSKKYKGLCIYDSIEFATALAFKAKKAGLEIFNLFVAGMSVCAVDRLPRMGPIFGGMLKSGKKAAEMIDEKL